MSAPTTLEAAEAALNTARERRDKELRAVGGDPFLVPLETYRAVAHAVQQRAQARRRQIELNSNPFPF
jgi:hypothetical protein